MKRRRKLAVAAIVLVTLPFAAHYTIGALTKITPPTGRRGERGRRR